MSYSIGAFRGHSNSSLAILLALSKLYVEIIETFYVPTKGYGWPPLVMPKKGQKKINGFHNLKATPYG